MKKTSMSLSFLTVLVALVVALPAFAVSYVEVVSFEAPFKFRVNETTLPAGDYIVEAVDQTNPDDMRIRTPDGEYAVDFHTSAMPDTWDVNEKMGPKAKVVFAEFEGEQYLTEVWIPAHSNGRQVITEAEMEDAEKTEISGAEAREKEMTKKMKKKKKKMKKGEEGSE